MRQLQSLVVDLLVTAVEQIDINGSRNVLWMIPFAAQRFLDLNQLLKQTRGIAFILKFNDRIQKFSGSRFATDRFSLVNPRGKNCRIYVCEIENCFSRYAQILKSIANIRAECDCGSHFSFRHVELSRDIPRSNLKAAQRDSSTALGMTNQ